MNDPTALKRSAEIVLAQESAFTLAGSLVRPAALEVEREGQRTSLEPRVMQVLVALYRGAGQPVSRDALIELCWGGRVVTEGALNRCVAQLRKALSPNPRIRVETISKVGYRLRSEDETPVRERARESARDPARESVRDPIGESVRDPVGESIGEPISEPVEKPTGRRRRSIRVALGVAAVVTLALVGWSLTHPRPIVWTATSYRPLTTEPAIETFPALSPDGEQIVYAVRPDATSSSSLVLRSVEQETPIPLTSGAGDDSGAAWAPRGDRIAFTRTPPQGPCILIVMPIPRGAERVATHCQVATQTRVSWLDDRTLVFSDQPTATDVPRIRAVDIQSGVTRDLTSPSAASVGDIDPVVSPNGRYIAFRRTLVPGADDLFTLDVTTGEEQALTTDGWKASGYAWSSDSRHVFFSSNRGGEFGLWSAYLRIPGRPRQVSLGLGAISFSRMSADRRNRLAVEIVRGGTNLARLTPAGEIQPITKGNGSEWEAAAAATDGTLAYISNRSGSYQVWVMSPGRDALRVTSLVASYVTSPTWSPDGQRIAFVAVTGRRAEVYTIARDGSQMRQLTNDAVGKKDPHYSAAGDRIFYIARRSGALRLMQISLAPGSQPQPVPGGEGWRALRTDDAAHLYGQRGGSIVTLDPSLPRAEVTLTDIDVWTLGAQGIYVRRGRLPAQPSAIWLYPWQGSPRKLADTPLASSAIAAARDGAVIFSQSPEYQVDLGLIELASHYPSDGPL